MHVLTRIDNQHPTTSPGLSCTGVISGPQPQPRHHNRVRGLAAARRDHRGEAQAQKEACHRVLVRVMWCVLLLRRLL